MRLVLKVRFGDSIATKAILFACLAALGWLQACTQEQPAEPIAVIGSRVITTADFAERLRDFKRRVGSGVQDTGQLRRELLNNYVNEEILITEAIARGFEHDSIGQFEKKRIQVQEKLNAYYRTVIYPQLAATDDELLRLYIRLNTKIKARHLYAPTYAEADSLYRRLQQGATFEELAQEVFQHPQLQASGGSLGYFTVDEMDPNFEEAAFSMRVGEVSTPIRTASGYSIVQVEDRKQNPLLTEFEFAKSRDRLEGFWRRRKAKQVAQAHVDSLRNALQISFKPATVAMLLPLIYRRDQSTAIDPEATNGHEHAESIDDTPLVQSRLGTWRVADFRERARFTSEKQQRWIRDEHDLQDYIAGLVVREYMLQQVGKRQLDRSKEFQKNVAKSWDLYLLERMQETIEHDIHIPEDTLRHYYDERPERFAFPPRLALREIVVKTEKESQAIVKALDRGVPFAGLKSELSKHQHDVDISQYGPAYYTPPDLGKWADQAFSLTIGETAGPLTMDSLYIFIQCVDKQPAQLRSFQEARHEIVQAMKVMRRDAHFEQAIAAIRQKINVQVDPLKLRTVTLQ